MHIAMFTPGLYPVTGDTVKATEYFVYGLANGLKKRGHNITLFAAPSPDSRFNIINPKYDIDINRDKLDLHQFDQYLAANFCDFLEYCNDHDIDVIHDHTTTLTYSLARYAKAPVVSTFHGIRASSILREYYAKNRSIKNISPSNFTARMSPDIEFVKTIYHGVDLELFNFVSNPESHFLHIGRIIPEKGQLDAIESSNLSKLPLKLAGYKPEYTKKDDYYNEVINQIEASPYVEFVGKIERRDVPLVMGSAKALLMPIKYEEVFGLVMIEAMACGTPVIAYNTAAAPEIVVDGVTGFLVEPDSPSAMADAMQKIDQIDRKKCREHIETNFSIDKMVIEYEKFYQQIASRDTLKGEKCLKT